MEADSEARSRTQLHFPPDVPGAPTYFERRAYVDGTASEETAKKCSYEWLDSKVLR